MHPLKTLRVVVCGDEGVGKSTLITRLVKEVYVPNIQNVLPPISIPQDFDAPMPYHVDGTILIDTLSDDVERLQMEIRNADVLWLVYLDHFTYERVSLHWMVMLRSMGVNLPIVLCANKSDLDDSSEENDGPGDGKTKPLAFKDEFVPIMNEFKEIEAAIRCSARTGHNVVESFYLCQRAVLFPLLPLFDSQQSSLQPALLAALRRIFFLCDRDQDGVLNSKEMHMLQRKCFGKLLSLAQLQHIEEAVGARDGLSEPDFILLNKHFLENGRHESTWGILRAFHYTDSLSLDSDFLFPKVEIPEHASVELSPIGYRFLVDLFILFDKDNDGGLNERELANLFRPTPGYPKIWEETNFPYTTVRNEQGFITLQGWLAHWTMSTLLDHQTTLEYFAYLGFETTTVSKQENDTEPVTVLDSTLPAIKVTKARRTRRINDKIYRTSLMNTRTVFNCFILGSPGCGKTALLDTFLQKPYNEAHIPSLHSKVAVHSVEVEGGKQHYLILEELGQLESAVLSNPARLDGCDVVCMAYDSSNPRSFQHLVDLRQQFPQLDELPLVFVGLKADLDRQQQRCQVQPEDYTKSIQLNSPLHVSCNWQSSVLELFLQLIDAAQNPQNFTPNIKSDLENQDELENMKNFLFVGCTLGAISVMTPWLWRRFFK